MLLTGEILPQKWKDFAAIIKENRLVELKLSNDLLDSMNARTSLKQVKPHGEGQSVSVFILTNKESDYNKFFVIFHPKKSFKWMNSVFSTPLRLRKAFLLSLMPMA